MSPRNFARLYTRTRVRTPAKAVEAIRLDAARRRLEESADRIEVIAETCGFRGEEQMRAAFMPTPTLWRVPFLGGTPRRLLDDVHSPVAWSPDGRSMAFTRTNLAGTRSHLVLANADGQEERELATLDAPDLGFFTLRNPGGENTRLAWSPDGGRITVAGWGFPGGVLTGYVLFVTVADGSVRAVPQTPPGASGAWLDGSSLVWSRPQAQSMPSQLWRLSYPDGQLSRLTNDLSSYEAVSITDDRGSLAMARTEHHVDIWVGDGAAISGSDVVPAAARPMVSTRSSIAWAQDRLLYTARGGGTGWLTVSAYGPNPGTTQEIVANADGPAATSDGRTIVYLSREQDTLNHAVEDGCRRPARHTTRRRRRCLAHRHARRPVGDLRDRNQNGRPAHLVGCLD